MALALDACALAVVGAAPAHAANEIVIGASPPLSGPLAGFGSFQQWGCKRAVEELQTFRAVRPWVYAWDLFFEEPGLAHAPRAGAGAG